MRKWHIPRRLPQLAIFAGLGLFLLRTLASGAFYWYLSDKLLWLVVVSTVVFLAIPVVLAGRGQPAPASHHEEPHDGAEEGVPLMRLSVMALPLILGVLVPARPLSASAVSTKELNSTAALTVSASAQAASLPSTAPTQYTILDWVRAAGRPADAQQLNGQAADVIGFVASDSRLPAGQFLVGRYVITHCIAEAVAVGMAVDWSGAAPATDAWVRVKGLVTVGSLGGKPVPQIKAESVEVVSQPARPYLYP